MADQLDPEELRRLSEAFERLTRQSYGLSDELDKAVGRIGRGLSRQAQADMIREMRKSGATNDQIRKAQVAQNAKHQAALRQTTDSLHEMGRAVLKLGSSIYRAEQGSAKYAETVDTVVTSLTALAFLLGGPMIKAVMVVVGGLVKMGKVSAEMADQLFKSYQAISRSGAAASDGLDGVFQMMQDFRLSTAELDQLNQIIAETAQGLALFRGTVYQGARSMGEIRRSITTGGLETQFMALGMNTQEINETLGAYIDLYSRLGSMETRTTREITQSIAQYVKETDAITKLTGATRKQQEEAQKRAMANEAFSFKVRQLREQGQDQEANRLIMTYRVLASRSQEAADGFAQMVTGIVSEGGVGAFLISNGQAMRAATDSTLSLGQTLTMFGGGLNEFMGGIGDTMASVNNFRTAFNMNYDELKQLGLMIKDSEGKFREINNEQDLMIAMEEKGVKNLVSLRTAELDTMQSMQSFVKLGVNPATAALNGLAQAARGATSILPGGGGTASAAKPTAGGGGNVSTSAKKFQGGIFGAIENFITQGQGFGSTYGGGPTGSMSPDDLFSFQGGISGNRSNFDSLDPQFRSRLMQMAAEYKQQTGKKLPFGSGQRSQEQNTQVGGAASSRHLSGTAVDLSSSAVDELRQLGLLDSYGFKQNPRSGWHISDSGFRNGGIVSGPESGYKATLHGTEAVVPLPDNRSIPVEMSGTSGNMDRQLDMMAQQITRLDDLVNLMRDQTSISQQILQVTNN